MNRLSLSHYAANLHLELRGLSSRNGILTLDRSIYYLWKLRAMSRGSAIYLAAQLVSD
jgi:hypothetical protein